MRTLSGDHERFENVYFNVYKGFYFTGDGCRRDADGYYWLTGDPSVAADLLTLCSCMLHAAKSSVVSANAKDCVYQVPWSAP